ncbi:MAG: FAD-dependent oxidoreductase [Actinomycetota bacterium]|nr:FAD-dependent oxidoreductase [Actinomycetota bacterium]
MAERVVVVGGDAAGMSAASAAIRRRPVFDVVAFERGPYTSYSACGIPYLLGGLFDDPDRLVARSPSEFRAAGIDVRIRCEVTAIDSQRRTVTYYDEYARREQTEGFDKLVYAAGAVAVAPPVPGAELVEPARTLDAAERLLHELKRGNARHAVVVGASYLGLEMAEALVRRGLHVTLVDRAEQVMPSLDPDMAAHVQTAAEGVGVRVQLSTLIEEIRADPKGNIQSVATSDGELPADHVVLSTGVRPATELAEAAGLRIGTTGALEVDDHQRCPGFDGVYAAGDCVESWHRVLQRPVNLQLGTHANKQGRIAGTNATGGDVAFPGVIGTAVSKICRYEVARTGISEREAASVGRQVVSAVVKTRTRAGYYPGTGPIWVKLIADARTAQLVGGQIVGVEGAGKRIDVLATAIWSQMTVHELELLDLAYAPPLSGVYDPLLIAARQTAQSL